MSEIKMWLLVLVFCGSVWSSFADGTGAGSEPVGFLTANGVQYNQSRNQYRFCDGMPANFSCVRVTDNGSVKLSYNVSVLNPISISEPNKSAELYIKLTSANHNTSLECTIIYLKKYLVNTPDDLETAANVIRMHLILDNEKCPKEGFDVNGLILPHSKKTEITERTKIYYHEYFYYPMEPLTITVNKDRQLDGGMQCHMDGKIIPKALANYFKRNNRISYTNSLKVNTSLNVDHSYITLNCTISYLSIVQSKITPYKEIELILTLIMDPSDYTPYTMGLSMANILLKYSDGAVICIKYEFTVGNDTYYVSCVIEKLTTRGKNELWPPKIRVNPNATSAHLICPLRFNTAKLMELVQLQTAQSLSTNYENKSPGLLLILPYILAGLAVLVLLGTLVKIRTKTRRRSTENVIVSLVSSTVEEEPIYATINENSEESRNVPVNIELKQFPLRDSGQLSRTITLRPPHPLPADALAENRRYRHYDTPYEHLIFRYGVQTCKCGRCKGQTVLPKSPK